LSRPENRYERSAGQLLEVYRRIRTPAGTPVLFETYPSYTEATARIRTIWERFAPISVGVLLLLLVLQLPLARRMVTQLRATQRERELLQERALDTSTEERRRIAGTLHDGIVQDMSASALLVAGAADRLRNCTTGRAADEVAWPPTAPRPSTSCGRRHARPPHGPVDASEMVVCSRSAAPCACALSDSAKARTLSSSPVSGCRPGWSRSVTTVPADPLPGRAAAWLTTRTRVPVTCTSSTAGCCRDTARRRGTHRGHRPVHVGGPRGHQLRR
jgi:hypothetical protein